MNNPRIAIQGKGKLADESMAFLRSLGLIFKPNGRSCTTTCENCGLDILFLRDDDIPKYVNRGAADFGIVGENVLLEQNVRVKTVRKLPFGRCSLVIAVPIDSQVQEMRDLMRKEIATSYPKILQEFLGNEKVTATTKTLKGAVEIAPQLDFADAICDLTQTGETLQANNLRVIRTVLESQAVLIQSPFISERVCNKIEILFAASLKTIV